jgi:hypothetical protein
MWRATNSNVSSIVDKNRYSFAQDNRSEWRDVLVIHIDRTSRFLAYFDSKIAQVQDWQDQVRSGDSSSSMDKMRWRGFAAAPNWDRSP